MVSARVACDLSVQKRGLAWRSEAPRRLHVIVVLLAVSLSVDVAEAQETCGLQTAVFGVDLFKDGFEGTAQVADRGSLQPSGGSLGPPISTVGPPALGITPTIAITHPSAGASLDTGRVQVVGTVSGPADTGVTVNGVIAYVHNGTFATPEFIVPSGATSLTATATTLDSLVASVSRAVVVGTQQPEVTITNDLPAGFAPLNASFLLSIQPSITVQSVAVAFGDGGTFSSTDVDEIPRHVYSAPGVYVAQVTVTDTGAQQYVASRRVVVLGLPQQRETICAVFAHLRTRLAADDVAGALLAFHPRNRPRYQELFNALGANRPIAAARLGVIGNGTLSPADAEVILINDDPEGLTGDPVHFSLDRDGVWRIDAM